MKLSKVLPLALALIIFGAGCSWFGQTEPGLKAELGGSLTQSEVERYNEFQDKLPKGLAYLNIPSGSKVFVSRGKERMPGKQDMALYAGDTVHVNTGEAKLLYPGKGMSLLPKGAAVTILPEGEFASGQGLGALIILEAGKIFTRFEQILGHGEEFSVQVDNVVATVRGTAFAVFKIEDTVDIQVAESTIKVTTRDAMDYLKQSNSMLADVGWELSAGRQISLQDMDEFRALAQIEPVSDDSFAYFDMDYYYSNLFASGTQDVVINTADRQGFNWMSRQMTATELAMPENPYHWTKPPVIDPYYLNYINPERLSEWQSYILWLETNQDEAARMEEIRLQMQSEGMFSAPVESADSQDESPASVKPSSDGPTDEPPESIIYYDENGQPHFTDEALGTDSNNDSVELLGVPAE
ncbi:hypothetical protein GF391_04045 [Candidatus Uhrbacteria bacterium]|nr:hypothetical protein [Candidatus Uhrbacteria bacterium]